MKKGAVQRKNSGSRAKSPAKKSVKSPAKNSGNARNSSVKSVSSKKVSSKVSAHARSPAFSKSHANAGKTFVSAKSNPVVQKPFDHRFWIVIAFAVLLLSVLAITLFGSSASGNVINGAAGGTSTSVTATPGTYNLNINLNSPPKNPTVAAVANAFHLGSNTYQIILSLIVLAIIFAGLFDILEITSIFNSKWVKIVIAVGLAVIAALTDVVNRFTIFVMQVAANLGAIGIALEIVISVVIFVGLMFGSYPIARFAAKRKGQMHAVRAIQSAGAARGALAGLKALDKEFDKP